MVFVLRVVAVLHVRARKLAEANRHIYTAAAVVHAPYAVDILARKLLPRRRLLAVTQQYAALFEVNVHVVAPTTAGFYVPDLKVAAAGRSGQSVRVHAQPHAAVALDRPRRLVGARSLAELESPVPGRGQLLGRKVRHGDHRLTTDLVVGRVHAQVAARVVVHPYLHELAHSRVAAVVLAGQYLRQRNSLVRSLAVLVLEKVDHVQAVARLVAAEINDYVIAFGYGLGRKYAVVVLQVPVAIEIPAAVKGHRVLEDVAVVGDHVKRHPVVASVSVELDQGDAHEARHVAVQDSQSVPAGAHVEVGLVQPVHRHAVTDETVEVKNIKPQLALFAVRAVLSPCLARHQDLQVVVAVAPVEMGATWKPQVDAVVDGLVAAIQRTVVVHHRGVALVNILGSVIEHVIVEPVRTHGFAPVTRDLDVALGRARNRLLRTAHAYGKRLALLAGGRGARIAGVGVYAVVAGQHQRPVVVVELPGQKEGLRVTVALGRAVAVVFVGSYKVVTEAAVGSKLHRQHVVVAQQ